MGSLPNPCSNILRGLISTGNENVASNTRNYCNGHIEFAFQYFIRIYAIWSLAVFWNGIPVCQYFRRNNLHFSHSLSASERLRGQIHPNGFESLLFFHVKSAISVNWKFPGKKQRNLAVHDGRCSIENKSKYDKQENSQRKANAKATENTTRKHKY